MKDNVQQLLDSRNFTGNEILRNPVDSSINTSKEFAKKMIYYASKFWNKPNGSIDLLMADFMILETII